MARLQYIGHAAVLLESSSGRGLLIDPYNSGGYGGQMGYAPIEVIPDFGLSTHDHPDHSAFGAIAGDFELVDGPGTYGPFDVSQAVGAHDEYGGRRRGGEVEVTRIEFDGRSVVHLSDVGHSPWSAVPDAMCEADVLLATCGGYYTIGAAQAWEWSKRLRPSVIVPIHFSTESCGLPIRSRANFEAHFRGVRRFGKDSIELTDALISLQEKVVLMDHVG